MASYTANCDIIKSYLVCFRKCYASEHDQQYAHVKTFYKVKSHRK